MAERTQKQRQAPNRTEETVEESPAKTESGDKLKAEMDDLLDEIVAANWDSLVFDVGREPLRRVPMMEPLRGTAEVVARLIDDSDTPHELLSKLGA